MYPHYIDSGKTVAEGRRIPKDKGENRFMVYCCLAAHVDHL